MAAAYSVSPFLPELLQVFLPRRDTWVLFFSLLPLLLSLLMGIGVFLPFYHSGHARLRVRSSFLKSRVLVMCCLLLSASLPYSSALSAGLTISWIPLPSPRSAPSSSRFSQDGWGTDLISSPISIQERLCRESQANVRAFVATQAFDNHLVAKYHLEDRTNRDAGLLNKRARKQQQRNCEQDCQAPDISEPGWATEDTTSQESTGWQFPTREGWTEIFINSDATTQQKLELQS